MDKAGNDDELKLLRTETRNKIAQLEDQVEKHTRKIADLAQAEARTLPAAKNTIPPPLVAPRLPSEVIEISDDDDDEPPSHAPKRTPKQERLVLDYVDDDSGRLLPQSSSSSTIFLPRRAVSPVPEPSRKRQKTSKVKVAKEIKKEIKKEAFTVPQDVVDQYLRGLQDLVIDPAPRDTLYVSRKFLRLEFGGNDQQFMIIVHFTPTDGSDKRRAVVFPQAGLNPFLPSRPGAAGLIFTSRLELMKSELSPWALFCKDNPSGEAVWRYMGEYESINCRKTTAEQFRQTQEHWGKRILNSKMWQASVFMRARIALRKTGRSADDKAAVAHEVKKIKAKKGVPLTVNDIIEALSRGDEWINIIGMQCISYDQKLVADMERKHDAWITPAAVADRALTAANKRPKRTATVKDGAKGKGKGKGPPARAQEPAQALDSDSASNFAVESENSAFDSDAVAIRPQRRRTAPRPHAAAYM
ncbi:hypothetical protein B0H11DRAFT_2340847 [Mycena galericulata]|nr:hypothetical protein B0H11DRAFT_2340847 [Mycena galericulata]